jgi:hypothetical protein
LKKVRRNGDGYMACCPAHDDQNPSLSIREKNNGEPLFHCFAGCTDKAIRRALGLEEKYSRDNRTGEMTTFDYCDEEGKLLYQVVRLEPKKFYQRRPDGSGGWINNLSGVRRVLYRLPKLLASKTTETVFICEGEKDCDRLEQFGCVVTTNVSGAGKWRDEYCEPLRKRNAAIIPDNDAVGRQHAEKVARTLYNIASSIKIIDLPGLPEKGDVSDWLNHGHTVEELRHLVNTEPVWKPSEADDAEVEKPIESKKRKSAATLLVALASDAELFHTGENEPFATVKVDGHREIWALRSKSFKRWLLRRFYEVKRSAPSSQALQDALGVLEGKALFEGELREVYVRLAEHDNEIYLDLCDDEWNAVKVSRDGWQLITNPPVRFQRTRGMLPLPQPVAGGSIKELREFLNVSNDNDWILVASWLVAALRPIGPYPILVLHGEQGSAKSTFARLLRTLFDPNVATLRSEPREIRDLMIAATNGLCCAFDNLSNIQPWLSDAICRLATGGGYATRELYSDGDEVIFNVQRPVILNGIEELATRGDLLDRAIVMYLPSIPEKKRRTESDVLREFEAARPRILGALLDAVSAALRNINNVRLPRLPRMADFAMWATSAEEALGFESGTFMAAYSGNRRAANDLVLESSPVAAALTSFFIGRDEWIGTATDLLEKLRPYVSESIQKQLSWPKSAKTLSNALRRLAPNLRATGISVDFTREGGTGRRLVILENTRSSSSQSSQMSHLTVSASENVTSRDDLRGAVVSPSHENNNENEHHGSGDACDGQSPAVSYAVDEDALNERAAKLEYECGLPRPEADRQARAEYAGTFNTSSEESK